MSIPSSFLHYRVIGKLGEGGMGVVYLAEDTKLKRKVALKFLPYHVSSNPTERKRFEQEAQSAAVLNHPNIAHIYAIEECEEELFIVMEYVDGLELKEVIDQKDLTLREKIEITEQIASGINEAHEKGIIHRDIKSRNIMVDEQQRVKIMDFGLARIQGTKHITNIGTTLGTTAYMSPEQLSGIEVDIRSDIWSFGVVLYELFTGELPFQGIYEPAVMYAIAEEAPIPISRVSTEVPEHIEKIISRCLKKDREQRYSNLTEVLTDLRNEADAKTYSLGSSNRSKIFRRKGQVYTGIAVASTLVILLLFFLNSSSLFPSTVPEKRYLAVLPIENISQDPNMQAICDGLGEIFSYKLSELEKYQDSYWVAPAGEMRKEQVRSATQANRLFGVNLAISSSIQTFRDSTRLILELIDADNIRRLDTEQVSVSSRNLALLERNGIKAMLKMLEVEVETNAEISQNLNEKVSYNPTAYEYYLKGIASLQNYISPASLNEAIQLFNRALEIDDNFALAHAGLGESNWRKYESTGNISFVKHAENSLRRALDLDSELAPVQTLMGILKLGTGDQELAIRHFSNALEIDPKYNPAFRGMAKAFDEQGYTEKAVNTYKRAIAQKPEYWEGYKDLGIHYLDKGNIDDAIGQFKQVVTLTPKSSSAYSNLGVAYYYGGQNDSARIMFERSLALDKNPLTANNLAGIYYWEGNYEEAANMYKIALQTYSDRYEIWGNLATAYDLSGQPDDARRSYLTAIEKAHSQLEINPNDAVVLADLGAYYSDINDSTNALAYLNKALNINEENIIIRQRVVSTYEKLGMRSEALSWINAAMIADIESQPELQALIEDSRYQKLKEMLTAQK
ncbi:protein kinase [Aliifodinibius sp. S!AR15-10]|uniref:protein kinase domain-containing protein n=1 Tax=Aliifodinibius sp. S!AR15-10 TaxID=2950437 RepID=UPI002861BCC2|nr:protein kinase [Aliifodinibius sp. S!AR15-10]MDR8390086.1 protein kinase [Aliifodinibius sp. S!AR15-10]